MLACVFVPEIFGQLPAVNFEKSVNSREGADTTNPEAPAETRAAQNDRKNDRKGELLFAPIPISSQAIGTGLAPVAAYVFFPSDTDKVSQPSILAVAGLYTSTKTYGLGIAGNFNLAEDRYRITFLTGGARARYEFFGIGNDAGTTGESLWLNQKGHAVFLQGLRRIGWNTFVGPRFSHRTIKAAHEAGLSEDLSHDFPQLPAIMDQLNLSLTTAALGFRVERDTRDSMFYPTRGVRMGARVDFFGPYAGSGFTFQNYVFEINKYLPVREGHVVALRAMGCGVTGERIPFYELCQFGMMGDLRGYQTGRFRDRAMFAVQGEWRMILPWWLGATAFGGVGEVAPDGKSFNAEDLLPSGGVGLRFNLSKQRRINLRLDLAYSRTGGSWSMGVAEMF
jgi:outer membrane protein assembly factor BamA